MPTPPAPPWTSTCSPGSRAAWSTSACQAVSAASGSAAAATWETECGLAARLPEALPCRAPAIRASPCIRPTRSRWTKNQPITVNNGGPALDPGFAGQAYTAYFFVIGGAAPYTWSLVSGQVPPGLSLATFSDPRDANDELAGTPTTVGTYTFTMRVTDYNGQQATQQFTVTVHPPLQVTTTTLPAGTVGVPYSHDLDLNVQGGLAPYS